MTVGGAPGSRANRLPKNLGPLLFLLVLKRLLTVNCEARNSLHKMSSNLSLKVRDWVRREEIRVRISLLLSAMQRISRKECSGATFLSTEL